MFKAIPYNPCRHSTHNRKIRHILSYHRTCANHCAYANLDPPLDERISTHPHISPNGHRQQLINDGIITPIDPALLKIGEEDRRSANPIYGMTRQTNCHPWCYRAKRAD